MTTQMMAITRSTHPVAAAGQSVFSFEYSFSYDHDDIIEYAGGKLLHDLDGGQFNKGDDVIVTFDTREFTMTFRSSLEDLAPVTYKMQFGARTPVDMNDLLLVDPTNYPGALAEVADLAERVESHHPVTMCENKVFTYKTVAGLQGKDGFIVYENGKMDRDTASFDRGASVRVKFDVESFTMTIMGDASGASWVMFKLSLGERV